MFHIHGSPRSGTTLLAQCLNAHASILVPHETDFIVPLAFLLDRIVDPDVGRPLAAQLIASSKAFPGSLGEYLDPAEIPGLVANADYSVPSILEAIYTRAATKHGRSLGGDKSPRDLAFIRILHVTGGLSPPIKVVHLVRDGRDVMASLIRANWSNSRHSTVPNAWAASNAYLADVMEAETGHYLRVRYEDLVSDPAHWLERICALLGIDYDPCMLDPERRHPRYRGQSRQHPRLYQAISTDGIGQYRKELTSREIERFERIAGEQLERFGYK